MSLYPAAIQLRLNQSQNAGAIENARACGRSASFLCGCSVGFSVKLGEDRKTIEAAAFNSNGCGYMIAAADVLAGTLNGKPLRDLHSLDGDELFAAVENKLIPFPAERRQCADVCIEALRATFADLRARRCEEFAGEKALVCTCFGVLEETIASHISERSLKTTDEVAAICNAGDGCGSCRMLIQEMLDARREDSLI
ncbi:MAG TPA: iron-sulfur cluster assembly scaffold protein [Pyrinomonadaceae bacterium]|nr:iron-sulfur cluster assembly scaffold protein [Pyrinomonadaceae bacterium]